MLSGVTKSLVIRFIADTSKASANINALINQLKGLSGAGQSIAKTFKALPGWIKIAAVATLGLVYTMRQAVSYGTVLENQITAMEQFVGSSARARSIIRDARNFSLLTPFSPTETFAATQQLVQAGVDPYKKGAYGLPKDKTAMDIIGGLGSYTWRGKKLGMEHAVMALQRGETRMLKPYGADVLGVHAKALTGGIAGTPGYIAKFLEEAGKLPQIMNMAKAQSETIAGLWSTISGFAEEAYMAISGADAGEGVITLFSQIRQAMIEIRDYGLDFMNQFQPFLLEFGSFAGSIAKLFHDLIKIAWEIVRPFAYIVMILGKVLFSAIGYIVRQVSRLLDFFLRIGKEVMRMTGIADFFKDIVTKLEHFYGWLSAVLTLLDMQFDQFLSKYERLWGSFQSPFDLSAKKEREKRTNEKYGLKGDELFNVKDKYGNTGPLNLNNLSYYYSAGQLGVLDSKGNNTSGKTLAVDQRTYNIVQLYNTPAETYPPIPDKPNGDALNDQRNKAGAAWELLWK